MNVTLNVNGLSIPASFSDDEITEVHLPLLKKLSEIHKHSGNRRTIVFLSAPPGTGKSTLTTFWEYLCQQDDSLPKIQTLPMDGFHHYNDFLDQHQLRASKGAPETFNVEKLAANLSQIRCSEGTWPQYSRQLHNPVEDAINVSAPIVIVEGNWLLLNDERWQALKAFSDFSLFIHAPEGLLSKRLIARKVLGGSSVDKAEAFYLATDGPNIQKVLTESRAADLTLVMDEQGAYHW